MCPTDPRQPSLFDPAEPPRRFDGETYSPERDEIRLTGQLLKVWDVMHDGRWYTIHELQQRIPGASATGLSARLRDFRKPQFGGHTVERKNVCGGLWMYRLIQRVVS